MTNGPVEENIKVVADPVVEDKEIAKDVVEERSHCWREDEWGGVHSGGVLFVCTEKLEIPAAADQNFLT